MDRDRRYSIHGDNLIMSNAVLAGYVRSPFTIANKGALASGR